MFGAKRIVKRLRSLAAPARGARRSTCAGRQVTSPERSAHPDQHQDTHPVSYAIANTSISPLDPALAVPVGCSSRSDYSG